MTVQNAYPQVKKRANGTDFAPNRQEKAGLFLILHNTSGVMLQKFYNITPLVG
ncbi:hypothetical protein [Glaesserella sp.]|uniref:hypothetical protein n=1 Tax=Glaesserella sp. TaxID=2094731 RepID=UPI00359F2964